MYHQDKKSITFLLSLSLCLSLFLLLNPTLLVAQKQYFPERENWEEKSPEDLGVKEEKLQEAIQFALDNEYSGSYDLKQAILKGFEREPYHDILGPTKDRGKPAGLIIKDGYIIGKYGDLERVDMTFSVTKSYLSTTAGVAFDQNLIQVDDFVKDYVWDGTYEGEHNSKITWSHLLTQSSDWSGELFGGKDWADRPPREGGIDGWKYRELKEPGTFFEYNDVRVNVLAYSLLQVFRQPLPQVLKENIMNPIGASTTWRWFGYDHSFTLVDGLQMQSVSGGGHSGGGMFVNTLDQARFAYLFLRQGNWAGEQLISEEWIQMARQSSVANESYGFMWWLNKGEEKWEKVEDENIYYAAGFGGNFIVIDEANDLLIVTRWLEPSQIGEMVALVLEAIK